MMLLPPTSEDTAATFENWDTKKLKYVIIFYWERQNIATLGDAKNTTECVFLGRGKKKLVVAA